MSRSDTIVEQVIEEHKSSGKFITVEWVKPLYWIGVKGNRCFKGGYSKKRKYRMCTGAM